MNAEAMARRLEMENRLIRDSSEKRIHELEAKIRKLEHENLMLRQKYLPIDKPPFVEVK